MAGAGTARGRALAKWPVHGGRERCRHAARRLCCAEAASGSANPGAVVEAAVRVRQLSSHKVLLRKMCDHAAAGATAFIVCVRSVPGYPLEQQPLFSTFLPSLAVTVTPAEKRSRPRCIYLCAQDDDEFYKTNAKEVPKLVAASKFANVFDLRTVRLLFWPSLDSAVNPTVLHAYADGAAYLHHAMEDTKYVKHGWFGDALRTLDKIDAPIVRPQVRHKGEERDKEQQQRSMIRPTLVRRWHLDAFRDYYPPQLPRSQIGLWMAAAYHKEASSSSGSSNGEGGSSSSSSKAVEAAGGHLPALVECGRHVLHAYAREYREDNATRWRRRSCVAFNKVSDAPIEDKSEVDRLSTKVDCRFVSGRGWCAPRS